MRAARPARDTVAAQTRNALATIGTALVEAGFAVGDVVRARYVVTDRAFVESVYDVLGEIFGEIRPAATMTVSRLVEGAMKVEIDVTAHRPSR